MSRQEQISYIEKSLFTESNPKKNPVKRSFTQDVQESMQTSRVYTENYRTELEKTKIGGNFFRIYTILHEQDTLQRPTHESLSIETDTIRAELLSRTDQNPGSIFLSESRNSPDPSDLSANPVQQLWIDIHGNITHIINTNVQGMDQFPHTLGVIEHDLPHPGLHQYEGQIWNLSKRHRGAILELTKTALSAIQGISDGQSPQ